MKVIRFTPLGCQPVWVTEGLVEKRIDELRRVPLPGGAPGIVGLIPVQSRAVPLVDLAHFASEEFRTDAGDLDAEPFALLINQGDAILAILAVALEPDPVEMPVEEWEAVEDMDWARRHGFDWWIDLEQLRTKLRSEPL